ncbi:MAG: M56 family metallopeptidase [Hyphomonadaceae bacterium]
MADISQLPTLIASHLGLSVALATALALMLLAGRRLTGAARHALAWAAFGSALVLPAALLVPGEGVLAMLLKATHAPVEIRLAAPHAPVEAPAIAAVPAEATPATPAVIRLDSRNFEGRVTLTSNDLKRWAAEASGTSTSTSTESRDISSDISGVVAAANEAPRAGVMGRLEDALSALPRVLPNITLPFLMVWGAGVLLLLVRLGRDLIATERMVARARPVALPASLARRFAGFRIARSDLAPGPMAAGLLRPTILLSPDLADRLEADEGRDIVPLLEHERAHIERFDMAAAIAQRAVLAFAWWSPALYWISNRIDEEREIACDEIAARRTGDPRTFARSLTEQAAAQVSAVTPRLAVGALGPKSSLGRRVRRLIDQARNGAASGALKARAAFAAMVLVAAAGLCLVPTQAAAEPRRDEAPDEKPPSDSNAWLQLAEAPRAPEPPAAPIEPAPLAPLAPPEPVAPPAPPAPHAGHDVHIDFEIDSEFDSLQAELEALGAELGGEFGMQIGAQVLAEMPRLLAEIDRALAEADIADADFDVEEVRDALEEARQEIEDARIELQDEFGPDFQIELRAELDRARAEVEDARQEMRASMHAKDFALGVAERAVREAMAEARAELAAARARGDFNVDFSFDFDDGEGEGDLDGGNRGDR